MANKYLFLDIDGVLNGHVLWIDDARSNAIRPECVAALNLILSACQPGIVLTSAWRYMIHHGAMTTFGFEYLLRTHGVRGIVKKIVGLTNADEHCFRCGMKARRPNFCPATGDPVCKRCGTFQTRGGQIMAWLAENARPGNDLKVVALDDQDLGITAAGCPLVLTSPKTGLTEKDARKAIKILGRV